VSPSPTLNSAAGDERNDQSKLSDAKRKKRNQDAVVNDAISGAAQSIDKLVSAVVQRNSNDVVQRGKEPDDDDWLFCKRLYMKLQNIPDSTEKEYFKLTTDAEVLKLSYGKSHSSSMFQLMQTSSRGAQTVPEHSVSYTQNNRGIAQSSSILASPPYGSSSWHHGFAVQPMQYDSGPGDIGVCCPESNRGVVQSSSTVAYPPYGSSSWHQDDALQPMQCTNNPGDTGESLSRMLMWP